MAPAGVDGEEAVAEETQYLAAIAVERRGDRVEELVQRVDIGLAAFLFGIHRGFAHVAHNKGGADRLAVAAADLAVQHPLAGIAAEIGGQHVVGELAEHGHLGGDGQMVLHSQQRIDHVVGKAVMVVGRPGAHHALHRTVAEGLHEGQVIGDSVLAQVLEDREFGRPFLHQPAADVLQIVVEQVIIRALQEAVRLLPGRHAEALDGDATGAPPGEAQRVVERMQH